MLPSGHRLHVVLDGITRGYSAVNIRKFVVKASRLADLVELGTLTGQAADVPRGLRRRRASTSSSPAAPRPARPRSSTPSAPSVPGRERIISRRGGLRAAARPSRLGADADPPGRARGHRRDHASGTWSRSRCGCGRRAIDRRRGPRRGVPRPAARAQQRACPGMATVHANSAREALVKLCTLPLLAGENISPRFVVPTVAASVDIVVHVGIDVDGKRRVREIVAVPGRVEADVIETEPVFVDAAVAAGPRAGDAAAPRTVRSRRHRHPPACSRTSAERAERARARPDMGTALGLSSGSGCCSIWRAIDRRQRAPRLGGPRCDAGSASCSQSAGIATVSAAGLSLADGCSAATIVGARCSSRLAHAAGRGRVRGAWPAMRRSRSFAAGYDVGGATWPRSGPRPSTTSRPAVRAGSFAARGADPARGARADVAAPAVRGVRSRLPGHRPIRRLSRPAKADLADPVGDRVVEALRIAREVGGGDLGRMLRAAVAVPARRRPHPVGARVPTGVGRQRRPARRRRAVGRPARPVDPARGDRPLPLAGRCGRARGRRRRSASSPTG